MKLTDPLRLVNLPRRLHRALLGVAAAMAVALLGAGVGMLLVTTQPDLGVPAELRALLGLLLATAAVVGPAALLAARLLRAEADAAGELIQAFSKEAYLVRWSYAPAVWERFLALQGEPRPGTSHGHTWVVLAGGAVATTVALLACGPMRWTMAIVAMSGTAIGAGLTALAKLSRRRSASRPSDSVVGRRGACVGGRIVAWGGPVRQLIGVTVVVRQEVTLLEVTLRVGGREVVLPIPVPPGSEALARKVARRLARDAGGAGGADDREDSAG